ncbi:phospholipase D beta 2-like isoform X2 [Camellia sinensis]|uniref:phospholipase D beta 2-like isoform X2 n=1 Tax=Camellia sinensis TaxID=4442 RepID=UPI001035DE9C|nr:phospholipase D beta 2-like isoform X2 [Camellia sinensis]
MVYMCLLNLLLIIDRIPDIIGITDVSCLNKDGPEAWHVQDLVYGKNVLIDMSIHTAYVKAICAGQHFIYIENQYFLGSSYNWTNHRDLGAKNLIRMETALKIANKIRAERFSAYIVIPMWPEGVPTGAPTQRILLWQVCDHSSIFFFNGHQTLL